MTKRSFPDEKFGIDYKEEMAHIVMYFVPLLIKAGQHAEVVPAGKSSAQYFYCCGKIVALIAGGFFTPAAKGKKGCFTGLKVLKDFGTIMKAAAFSINGNAVRGRIMDTVVVFNFSPGVNSGGAIK